MESFEFFMIWLAYLMAVFVLYVDALATVIVLSVILILFTLWIMYKLNQRLNTRYLRAR